MQLTNAIELKKEGYIYYSEVNDWIKWYGDEKVEDVDGGWGLGWVIGYNPVGKEYSADCQFLYAGGWEIQLDTISNIEER